MATNSLNTDAAAVVANGRRSLNDATAAAAAPTGLRDAERIPWHCVPRWCNGEWVYNTDHTSLAEMDTAHRIQRAAVDFVTTVHEVAAMKHQADTALNQHALDEDTRNQLEALLRRIVNELLDRNTTHPIHGGDDVQY